VLGLSWTTRASATVVNVNVLPVPLVSVGLGVDVNVCDAVGVLVSVGVSVSAGEVCVGVRGVAVGMVWVAKGVNVAVNVAVSVAVEFNVTTSSGGRLPSREENVTPSLLSAASTNVYVPLPVIKALTLYSTQVFVPIEPLLSRALVVRAGRLFQVMPVSVHVLLAR
jgi:hypothetical protein